MSDKSEKDVRFTKKHVDEAWKKSATPEVSSSDDDSKAAAGDKQPPMNFASFIASLGIQCLAHLGELKTGETKELGINLEAAKETIDLLVVLKDKTAGNVTQQEETLLVKLIADLQMKYVACVREGKAKN